MNQFKLIKKGKSVSELQLILTVIFTSAYIISNVITVKQFQFPFGITMTGAIFLFPVTYILSDVFSEVYGYRWSRVSCYLAFAMNICMVLIFEGIIALKAAPHWEFQDAFKTTLGSAPRIVTASLTAYVLGDLANDRLFRRLKSKHPNDNEGFGFRAIISSFVGEFVDCLVFLPLAFYGTMPFTNLIVMTFTQVFLKVGYEVIFLPLTTLIVKKVDTYEKSFS